MPSAPITSRTSPWPISVGFAAAHFARNDPGGVAGGGRGFGRSLAFDRGEVFGCFLGRHVRLCTRGLCFLRAGELFGLFRRDDHVASALVTEHPLGIGQRLNPALARRFARAGRLDAFLEFERVGRLSVGLAID